MDKVQMARQFIEAIPHARDLGLKLIELENGVAVITMPYDKKQSGDGRCPWRRSVCADGHMQRRGCHEPPRRAGRNGDH